MKRTTLLGIIAFGSTITYLFFKSREENSPAIEGIEVKVNPKKLIDGALAMSNIHPTAKDGLRTIAHNAINKYYDIEE
jgi:hypothetical protein